MANTQLIEAARKAALRTKVGKTITGETIRLRCQESGVTAPTPSAWGGVIQSLVRANVLTKTDETVRAKSIQARGRRLPVYTRNSTRVAA